MRKNHTFDLFKYLSLLFVSFLVLFPFYTIFINAFKSNDEFGTSEPFALPKSFLNFHNFALVFTRGNLDLAFFNIFIIIVLSLIGNILIGTMVAYALGRFNFKFKKVILSMFIIATVIPTITTQVAIFSIIKWLHLFNTLYAPVVLFIGADIVQIYIYLQFIKNIPYELDESAMMDGASLFKIYRSIIFPLLTPATATLVILKTIQMYNEMYIPFLYMPKTSLGVVSTALMRFSGNNQAQWNLIAAAILLIMIPTLLIYLFLQKYIFSGITSGAVK